jgi:hypothetical protein
VTNPEDARVPARVLVDLYIRLRDELDGGGDYSLDPNHKVRASLVMAIFSAAEAIGSDMVAIETRARNELTLTRSAVGDLSRPGTTIVRASLDRRSTLAGKSRAACEALRLCGLLHRGASLLEDR